MIKKKPTRKKIDEDAAITVEEALATLNIFTENRKKRVHTMETSFFGIMGCNMDLTHIKNELKTAYKNHDTNIRLAGERMRSMKHGVAYLTPARGWLFLETDEYKVKQLLIKKGMLEEAIPFNTHIKGERGFGKSKK